MWDKKQLPILNKLLDWLYSQDILSKKDKNLKDKIFREYTKFNDNYGRYFPKVIKGKSEDYNTIQDIEYQLQKKVQEFVRYVLGKYSGMYSRKSFYIDKLLSQYKGLIKVLEEEEWEYYYNYWAKKSKIIDQDYAKLIKKLQELCEKGAEEFLKVKLTVNQTAFFRMKYENAKNKGLLTPAIEKINKQLQQVGKTMIERLKGAMKLAELQKKVLGKDGDVSGSGAQTIMKLQNYKESNNIKGGITEGNKPLQPKNIDKALQWLKDAISAMDQLEVPRVEEFLQAKNSLTKINDPNYTKLVKELQDIHKQLVAWLKADPQRKKYYKEYGDPNCWEWVDQDDYEEPKIKELLNREWAILEKILSILENTKKRLQKDKANLSKGQTADLSYINESTTINKSDKLTRLNNNKSLNQKLDRIMDIVKKINS